MRLVNDLDAKELKRLQKIGLWMFYMTPRRVIHNLRRSGLKNGFRMALAMLSGLLSKPDGLVGRSRHDTTYRRYRTVRKTIAVGVIENGACAVFHIHLAVNPT